MTDAAQDDGWRHLSPLSPVLRLGVFALAIIGYFIAQAGERFMSALGGGWWTSGPDSGDGSEDITARAIANPLIGLAVLVAVLSLVGLAAWLSWRFSRFRITERQVEFRKGWLFREHRQVPMDRIQAVELRRPLLAQLLRLAEVDVQSAGGKDSHLKIAFLPLADAHQVRLQIQRLAAGPASASVWAPSSQDPSGATVPTDLGAGATPPGALAEGQAPRTGAPGTPGIPDVPTGPVERTRPVLPGELFGFAADEGKEVLAVPNGRLFIATMLHGSVFALLGAAALGMASSIFSGGRWSALQGLLVSLPAAGPIAVGIVASRVKELLKHGNFRLSDVGSTVRIVHGLTDHRTTSIPLQRVQALELVQPLWWRPLRWWRARVNVAGAGKDEMDQEQGTVVLPVGSLEQALAILTLIDPALDPAAVRVAALGEGGEDGWVTASRSARFLDPWSWRRRGYAVSGHGVLLRSGRWTRSVTSVPHARIQSLTVSQGPLERRLGLADVHLISTPGPVSPHVQHLDVDRAQAFIVEEAARASTARRGIGGLTSTACAEGPTSGGLATDTTTHGEVPRS